jgi:hypothetical protein
MKLSSRILIALFAVLAAIAWCLLPIALKQLANGMRGMSDGAVSQSGSVPLPRLLLLVGIWLVPMTAFVLMFLTAMNVLKGVMRRVAYWYSLVFLIVVGGGIAVYTSFLWSGGHLYGPLRLIALAFLLAAGLWGFAFRKSVKQETSPPG